MTNLDVSFKMCYNIITANYGKSNLKGELAMPNGHEHKEYGGHKYADHDGTSNCEYGCDCWMGPFRSGGPIGLDPFGKCPNNPIDGVRRGGNTDYRDVVEQRIRDLTTRLSAAESKLCAVKPSKLKLAEELQATRQELFAAKQRIDGILELARSGD